MAIHTVGAAGEPLPPDILLLKITTSGRASARRAAAVSPDSRLSQAVFFSADCLPDLRTNFSDILRNFYVASGLRALY
jgi:hypothetical protein